MYRITGNNPVGTPILAEFETLEDANVWLNNQFLLPGRKPEHYTGPVDVSAEYAQKEAEKTQLNTDFEELKNNALTLIDNGTLFSSFSNAEKKVLKTLIKLTKR